MGGFLEAGGGGFLYPGGGGFLFVASGGSAGGAPPAPAGLGYDFTTKAGVAASGVVVTRSGATIYPQLSASTVEPGGVGNNLPIWEDRGDAAGGGLWVFDTYTNSHADPFDFSTSWTQDGGITYTPNVAIGPDGGATSVDRIRDNSAVADQRVYRAGAAARQYTSLWVRDVAGDAPTAPGMLAENLVGGGSVSLGSGTTWRRVSLFSDTAAATQFAIYASTLAGTGAIEVWGSQRLSGSIPRWFDLPLAMGGSASGLCTVAFSGSAVASVLGADGEFDFETSFIAAGSAEVMVPAIGTDIHLFKFDTPNGEFALRYGNLNHWTLMVNGVDRLSTTLTPTDNSWRANDEVSVRVYVTPTTVRIRTRVNCSVGADASTTVATMTLAAPTAGWLGSQGTTVGTAIQGRLTKFQTYTDHSSMLNTTGEAASIVVLGDSTIASYDARPPVAALIGTVAESRAGKRIANIAYPGSTIANNTTRWNASQYAGNTNVVAALIQVGINDVGGALTVAQMTTNYQALISAVRTGNAAIKIIANLMLPADAWTSMDATDQQNWIDLNSCIAGVAAGGGAAITGIDMVISAPSITANNNGSVGAAGVNTLKAIYELATSPDGVHPNTALREIIAAADRAALISLGVW